MSPATIATRLSLLIAVVALLGACANSDPVSPLGGGGEGSGPDNTPQDEDAICLLNNCSADEHCSGCSDGLNTCLLGENRCVACDRQTGQGCADGEQCTPYGKCVPAGQTCATDAHGTPTVTCGSDSDCAACDPQHQVCNPDSNRCVGCTDANTTQCQSTDSCVDNECRADCPQSCDRAADCASCGVAGKEAHACNAHRCAQCSPSTPCPNGQICTAQGACVAGCGKQNNDGKCDSDADCVGCGSSAPKCNLPLNGGVGTCGPEANGCSDLGGAGSAVLPPPYNQVTNLCSNDNDCANVGATVNVGKMLRDLTNINAIGDANITYGMHSCANITIKNTSCGVCVPCKVDSDCDNINIDQVAMDAFGPIGSLAAAFLLDQIFGPNSHEIHMYCDQIAGGYGACVPCPNWLSSCSTGGFSGGGQCSHDVCQVGGSLNTSCSSCAQQVCNVDAYCCNNQWDNVCVQEAQQICGESCSGGGQCAHDECNQGGALGSSCSSCATDVCNADPYCCNNSWDALCVQKVAQYCPSKTCSSSGGSCSHDECNAGGSLTASCSTCAGVVCNVDPYCCSTAWDAQCTQEADQMCAGKSCGMGGGCAHDECSAGASMTGSCSSCAAAVCAADPYCCNTEWDSQCVSEVGIYCPAKTCAGGGGGGGTCAHDPCSSGNALGSSCSSCASTVCASDPYCCSTLWDSQCVDEAKTMCQLSCNGGNSGNTCSHDECVDGGALTSGCSSCATTVCNTDPYCCNNTWDSQCIGEAEQLCNFNCGGGGGGQSCAHDECSSGGSLNPSCSSCASAVCASDPYCCNTDWDSQCVDEVDLYCSFTCL